MTTQPAQKKWFQESRSHLKELHPKELFNLVQGTFALAASLPKFFREPITLERAERETRRALESRDEKFLDLIRTRVYERPSSPYRKLLKLAGCEFSDLRNQVRQRGLEGTLEQLAREGVYLTSDEFKGKKEVARGGESFRVLPDDFMDQSSAGYVTQSSGTSNRPVRMVRPLSVKSENALARCIFLSAHDLLFCSHAIYDAILPGQAVSTLLGMAKLGIRTDRWFAREAPVHNPLHRIYFYLTTYLTVLMGKWFGPGFPRPEFIDADDVGRIVQWAAEKRREGKACAISTAASSAVKIARAALASAISLEGTKFILVGEPLTEAKWETITKTGAGAVTRYAFSGAGNVGFGCANPFYIDEVHVNHHMTPVVLHPRPISDSGPAIHPLLFTTLDSSCLMLNVENGDYGVLERRDCGCGLEKLGLKTHLHHIRSYEKFTSEGMNYFYGDLYELFEKILPAEFGGGPGDYQLVEEEDGAGQTRLTLVVHPGVGKLDEEKLLRRLGTALSEGGRGNRYMAEVWQTEGTLRVRRQIPYASPMGKILPLHIPHDY